MAVYFNLGLVARTQNDADACIAFFRARPLVLDGATIELETCSHARDVDVLVGVWPKGMSYASPHGDDRRLTTDAAQRFIALWFEAALIEAPPFAAAFFGGEAYDYFLDEPYEPLHEQLGGYVDGFHTGLYVDAALWEALGRPADAVKVGEARYGWPEKRSTDHGADQVPPR
jgi:hypothetical protein